MTSGERPKGSFFNREVGRRTLLKKASEYAVSGGLIVASGSALGVLLMRAERIKDSLYDEPVDGKLLSLSTRAYGELREIPVRSSPEPHTKDENLIAWTIPGGQHFGKLHYGRVYPTQESFGNVEGQDERRYGLWYKVDAIVAYKKDENDELVPDFDPNTGLQKLLDGVYIAKTFIRENTDSECIERNKVFCNELVVMYESGKK